MKEMAEPSKHKLAVRRLEKRRQKARNAASRALATRLFAKYTADEDALLDREPTERAAVLASLLGRTIESVRQRRRRRQREGLA